MSTTIIGIAFGVAGFAIGNTDWFQTPGPIAITVEGTIGATVKTFDTSGEADLAVSNWNNHQSETVNCPISKTTCKVFFAVKIDKANPAGTTRTLTFGCTTTGGARCQSNLAATFPSNQGTTKKADITITPPSERNKDDITLSITSTWS